MLPCQKYYFYTGESGYRDKVIVDHTIPIRKHTHLSFMRKDENGQWWCYSRHLSTVKDDNPMFIEAMKEQVRINRLVKRKNYKWKKLNEGKYL